MSRARTLRLLALLTLITLGYAAMADMRVHGLRCEYQVNPLGIDEPHPRLQWQIGGDGRGKRQSAFRVLVASAPEILEQNVADLWDSGRRRSSNSIGEPYDGKPLSSGQECYWKVRVWDQTGHDSGWSEPARWEMGLLSPSDWKSKWIGDGKPTPTRDEDFYRDDPAPLFRKEFHAAKAVRSARLYISGLGYYEATLNGGKVGDHVLDPGWTAYDKRVYYATYDVTKQILAGKNCLGVSLGNGWFNPLPLRLFGSFNLREHLTIGRPRFIAQLDLTYADGRHELVCSDESWRVGDGPIRFDNVYLGERFDANDLRPGWDRVGYDDRGWRESHSVKGEGRLQAQPQPPIRIKETWAAVKVSEPQPKTYVYDFGREFGGWASLRIHAPAGAKVVLRYGELLHDDGTLNPMTSVAGQIKHEGSGGPGAPPIAWQTDTFISNGAAETYTPRFTFHAFRYMEVTGLDRALPLSDVRALSMHADVPIVGHFECSHPLFNQIQEMCRRTFLANLFSVQSDCPHRERLGYGGDIAATSEALIMNFDMSRFYGKALQDFADAARPDGMLTDTAPFIGIQYCGVGWAMAHPLLAEDLYRYYGDSEATRNQYATAKRWLALVEAKYPDGIVTDGLSDHEALMPNPSPEMVTPLYLQATRMLQRMADRLGEPVDALHYQALADRISTAYRDRFVDKPTGRIGTGSQGNQAFGLYSGLASDASTDYLLKRIDEKHGHLETGIFGTKFMLDWLSRTGHADVAFRIVDQRDYPGWGWMLANGATTLWEHWEKEDNVYSHCHPMFGTVSQWFMNWLGGIQPGEGSAGWDHFVIRPQIVGDLQWVKSGYDSVRGPIVSNWRRQGDTLTMDIEVPGNSDAIVYLPTKDAAATQESGRSLAGRNDLELLPPEAGALRCRIGSGRYSFKIQLEKQ